MIPSRGRPDKLVAALLSITGETNSSDYEICISLDDDDKESLAIKGELVDTFEARVYVRPRLGYAALDSGYYAGLEGVSDGYYVWIAGDDMTVSGDWLEELRRAPRDKYIIQPEVSKLGLSTYVRAEAQAFPIFPRHCWKAYTNKFPCPFDTNGDALLKRNGWKTWFLPGITFHHHEASPEELKKHRQ